MPASFGSVKVPLFLGGAFFSSFGGSFLSCAAPGNEKATRAQPSTARHRMRFTMNLLLGKSGDRLRCFGIEWVVGEDERAPHMSWILRKAACVCMQNPPG